jgi:hypothetical protein
MSDLKIIVYDGKFFHFLGVSLPGLAMRHLMKDLGNDVILTNENDKNKDLHEMAKKDISGGPNLAFTRYHRANHTRIRKTKNKCGSIIGLDCNSLYLSTFLGVSSPNFIPCFYQFLSLASNCVCVCV